MLKVISSKNDGDIYSLSKQEKTKAKINSSFIEADLFEAVVHAENISIFGQMDAYIVRVTKEEELETIDQKVLDTMQKSEHFFVLVGSGVAFEKVCEKFGQKVLKATPKFVSDFPGDLVNALQKHDRKNAWNLLLKELNTKDAEPTHGVCVFAYKTLLVYLNDTKKNDPQSGVKDFSWNNAKRNSIAGKRERPEVVGKYFDLILAYYEARNGRGDLAKNLEKWVLK